MQKILGLEKERGLPLNGQDVAGLERAVGQERVGLAERGDGRLMRAGD